MPLKGLLSDNIKPRIVFGSIPVHFEFHSFVPIWIDTKMEQPIALMPVSRECAVSVLYVNSIGS